ncbi:MAG: CCA tRNA nucleotidyltransferase [Planctomycetes bacterium]|jgi:poly(A) polymerase|nr:CCA tRNA nucleotidyltransferase [Phycisphaerae bacterium]NBB95091.1 CCA tRNA nucleotidyltransferase [Planctomycetota bacterium]
MVNRATRATALHVLRTLHEAGYEAYFAGGCVRDMLRGERPNDYDIATSATPRQIQNLFRRVLMVGATFGVAIVLRRDADGVDRQIEVATFRSDLSYSDGRRPDSVTFSSPREDAERRDFTINGMFYDPLAEKVIDFVGGQADLAAGVIRTIGEPQERFDEDYLRLLRAVRFAARLGFDIDPATADAARRNAANITSISGERIVDELTKMLALDSAADALRGLAELDLAKHVLPELDDPEVWQAAVARVERLANHRDATLALGGMLCDVKPPAIASIVRRWGGSNDLKAALQFLAEHCDDWQRAATMERGEFKRLLASEYWRRLEKLWQAREALARGETIQTEKAAVRAAAIPPERVAPDPFVTGADLIDMGLTEGPRIGAVLSAVYDAQLNEAVATRDAAIAMARRLIDEA